MALAPGEIPPECLSAFDAKSRFERCHRALELRPFVKGRPENFSAKLRFA